VVPLVVTAAARHTSRPERWLVGSVLALVPYSMVGDAGTGWQIYGFVYVVASIAAAGALVRRRTGVAVPVA
jgi:hypothetical protein